jgi:predicted Co/Zn/Cd cation transporter (cation efflux family)
MIPLMAIISIISIHWNQFIALIGLGQEPARFDLVWKKQPLSLTYIATIMAIIALFEFLPYLEELVRGLRANHGKLVPPRDRTREPGTKPI